VDILELGPGDEALLARAIRTFRDLDAAAPDLFLQDPRTHAFVARDGDEVIGWCYGYELLRPEGRWMMLLQRIEVVPERRREGAGRQLLEAFVALAHAKGHHSMWLYVDAGSGAAHRLYERADGANEKLGSLWVFG
jgi:GNAT superfamily N-acetyltransferase